jgi:hypothetical protein
VGLSSGSWHFLTKFAAKRYAAIEV